ncbi:hypothetical protein Tco_0495989 [Tanacetum coccineum]
MKLDPSECTFGMEAGKFLGYVATTKGIKSDPEKVKVILRSTTPKEKAVLTLTHTTRSLRKLFRTYKVSVVTDGPIEEVLKGSGTTGRLAPWAAELRTYHISYIQRKGAEGQIVKKFFGQGEQVLQTSYKSNEGTSGAKKEPQEELTLMPRAWRLYVGRESNKEGLEDNMDYEALLARLVASTGRGMQDLHVFVDSKCLVDCVEGIRCQEQKNQRGIGKVSINLTRSLNQEVSVGVKTRPSMEVQAKLPEKIGNVSKKAASGRSSPTWEDHSGSN